jgi:hypothetical protein
MNKQDSPMATAGMGTTAQSGTNPSVLDPVGTGIQPTT